MSAERRQPIRRHLAAVAADPRRQITYRSEWLGYLPYGAYQWLEVDGRDVTAGMPADWELDDLVALEREGFLDRVDERRDAADPDTLAITWRVG